VDVTLASTIAEQALDGARDRYGEPLIGHVARVAAAVPLEAQAVAWLHEVLERSPTALGDLEEQGLDPDEAQALLLLTRPVDETYEVHALRIAHARGRGGTLARTVKLADLDDHLRHPRTLAEPPYGWARQHVLVCADRYDHAPPHAA
jgi:hypothetical protein